MTSPPASTCAPALTSPMMMTLPSKSIRCPERSVRRMTMAGSAPATVGASAASDTGVSTTGAGAAAGGGSGGAGGAGGLPSSRSHAPDAVQPRRPMMTLMFRASSIRRVCNEELMTPSMRTPFCASSPLSVSHSPS